MNYIQLGEYISADESVLVRVDWQDIYYIATIDLEILYIVTIAI